MSKKIKIIEFLKWATLLLGVIALGITIYAIPSSQINIWSTGFILISIFLSSFLQFQIPRTKLYFTISDTLIFICLLSYGGEAAVLLAAAESLWSSLNFRRKGIKMKTETVLLNGALASCTTFATLYVLRYFFVSYETTVRSGRVADIVLTLCVMALTQFFLNSIFISFLGAAKYEKPVWKIWYENCLNALVMYLAGAFLAGLVSAALHTIEPFLLLVAAGFAATVVLTYRRYVTEIKTAATVAEKAEHDRAEQAENHIKELQHYIREQESTSHELRESRERFRHAAFHDSLTELPNRNFFIETLKFRLEQTKHAPLKKFAVLFLDLNRFKTINDSLGHSMGDRLILHVAKRLAASIKEGDLVARFGGDEFAIILNSIAGIEDAIEFAKVIKHKISLPFTIGGRKVFTGVSIGIALNNPGYEEAEEILRDADIAMYHAKENHLDLMVFDRTMHTRAVTLLQLETDLRHAIERDELLVYYQPIVDLATMKLNGFEALMRWNHPQRGIIPPSEFIPVSEDTGLIIPLTLWILRKSCAQMVKWQRHAPFNKDLMISINLSGKHFSQPDLVEQIKMILAETGFNPLLVKLEITESAVMENAERAISLLKELRQLGVQLSIDDFGTGYSSLSYLHRFPIDILKIDRSFVSTMEDGSENGEIVRTIISLAKTLNLNVVAEGIETIHQLHQLRILGCEYGQGYLFSRPVSAEEATVIVEDQTRWQNIIPNNNPSALAQNREYTHLRLAK